MPRRDVKEEERADHNPPFMKRMGLFSTTVANRIVGCI